MTPLMTAMTEMIVTHGQALFDAGDWVGVSFVVEEVTTFGVSTNLVVGRDLVISEVALCTPVNVDVGAGV